MKLASAPVRFLAGIFALWIGARIWWLLPEDLREDLEMATPAEAQEAEPSIPARGLTSPKPTSEEGSAGAHVGMPPSARPIAVILVTADIASSADGFPPQRPATAAAIAAETASDLPMPPHPVATQGAAVSRWSGNAYLFIRDGGGDALAAGGQLGGSQAGARIAWRINRDGPTRATLSARVYAPLDNGRATEAAAGIDIYPLPDQPLRLSVERRFDVGGEGRSAWSAYAAGGFWRQIGQSIEIDGYAQAGIVGARSRDLFADGALRVVERRDLDHDLSLRMGAGIWAGAQPGVERLDIGPRLAVGVPLGRSNISTALEGRFRIAGDASPGSGIALTIATDF